MPTYIPADVEKLEYIEDPDGTPTTTDVNFIDPSAFTITETPVRQGVNERKQVTAMKDVEVDCILFDHDELSGLRTIEQDLTEIAWKITLLDGTTIQTEVAPISIGRELSQADGLQGFQIMSSYGTDNSNPVTDTYPA